MSNRCLYTATFAEFLNQSPLTVLGALHNNYHGDSLTTTDEAWMGEITLMQQVLEPWKDEAGQIVFEYDIPRLGKRIDVVLLLRGMIFCLEFKVGKKEEFQAGIEQVMDYALDLKNFHLFSHDRKIVPILVPTRYKEYTTVFQPSVYNDDIYNPMITGEEHLQELIARVLEHAGAERSEEVIDNWLISPYAPTPTIIEAARTLFENHSVEDITRHEADKVSTDRTINYILDFIQQSKEQRQKSICFVTGVPGAGKTLVGLDVAIKQTYKDGELDKENGAVYLSGNGPLVAVLTEALARDKVQKEKDRGRRCTKTEAERQVSRFIQIIHRYRDNMLGKLKMPIRDGQIELDPAKISKAAEKSAAEVENVAIFDEAQRMWDMRHLSAWLARKKGVNDFPMSEGEFLIWSLDQHKDWATIVCLVGGGQEINSGEGGIGLWIDALNQQFPDWQIYISNQLTEKEYAEGNVSDLLAENSNVHLRPDLHLAVSQRSYRAETLSLFVHQFLDLDIAAARKTYDDIKDRYPIVLTRDLAKAKAWLREHARGSERYGMLVSSKAFRLKPLAIDIRSQADIVPWFLNPITDIRSSLFLEDVATEFDIQGLELDWTCLVWDGDFRHDPYRHCWQHFNFRSDRWQNINIAEGRAYQLNAYRVLLTRARQGMVICVPEGNPEDATRLPEFYDGTYELFRELGLTEI